MLTMKTIAFLVLLSFVAAAAAAAKDVSGLAVTTEETKSSSDVKAAAPGFSVSAAVTETVTFDVTQGQASYTRFMRQDLYNKVLRTTTAMVAGRPQLGRQKLSTQPDTWIHVALKAGAMTATLAMRADNLYIVGFKAQDGAWYCFKGTAHQLPAAKPLSFGGDYASLTGGGTFKKMDTFTVGKSATQLAVSTLAQYNVGGTVPEDELRKALAVMVLTVSEAQRFTLVFKNVMAVWDNGGRVSGAGVELLVSWKDVSCALIGSQKNKKWSSIPEAKKIEKLGDPKMKDAKAAVQNIIFVLLPATCDAITP